jgi:hypothetical protein
MGKCFGGAGQREGHRGGLSMAACSGGEENPATVWINGHRRWLGARRGPTDPCRACGGGCMA